MTQNNRADALTSASNRKQNSFAGGKAVPTIYSLCHQRKIPHFKQGKDLYFRRSELLKFISDGKRKTHSELALEAETFSPEKSRQ